MMRFWTVVLTLALCIAAASFAAETRVRYSNGSYNATTSFGGTWHPGTMFTPESGQYPVFLKTAHFGFSSSGVSVQAKVWEVTGSTVGSLIASFSATTSAWPAWTDVDLTGSNIVLPSDNFLISTNNPSMGPLGSGFRGVLPQSYSGHHWWSSNDTSWSAWSTSDWAIECTIDTNYNVDVAPSSIGRIKALYE